MVQNEDDIEQSTGDPTQSQSPGTDAKSSPKARLMQSQVPTTTDAKSSHDHKKKSTHCFLKAALPEGVAVLYKSAGTVSEQCCTRTLDTYVVPINMYSAQ